MLIHLCVPTGIDFKIDIELQIKESELFLKTYDEKTSLNSGEYYIKKISDEVKLVILRPKNSIVFYLHILYKGLIIDSYNCKFRSKNINIDKPIIFSINVNKIYNLQNLSKLIRNDFLSFLCNEITKLKKYAYEEKTTSTTSYMECIVQLQKLREKTYDIKYLNKILRAEYLCFLNSELVFDDILFKIPNKIIYENKSN